MTTQEKKESNPCALRVDGVRLSFPSLDKMRPNFPGSDKQSYQATLLFPPGFDFTKLHAAMKVAVLKKFNKLDVKGLKNPLRNNSEVDYGYPKDGKFLATKSSVRIPMVGPDKSPVEPSVFYAGCYVNAHIEAWAYDNASKGISFDIRALQFVKDGERLDGRGKPSDPDVVFDALELPPEGGEGGDTGDDFNPF